MTHSAILNARLDLETITELTRTGNLTQELLAGLVKRLAESLDRLEAVVEAADPVDFAEFRARDGSWVGIPVCRVTFHGDLTAIDGGRS
jgi:hypothetical protein